MNHHRCLCISNQFSDKIIFLTINLVRALLIPSLSASSMSWIKILIYLLMAFQNLFFLSDTWLVRNPFKVNLVNYRIYVKNSVFWPRFKVISGIRFYFCFIYYRYWISIYVIYKTSFLLTPVYQRGLVRKFSKLYGNLILILASKKSTFIDFIFLLIFSDSCT
jgi:hypothetical protein